MGSSVSKTMAGEEDSAGRTVEVDLVRAAGPYGVYAGVWVARVDEDLLVLLVPCVHYAPLEPGRSDETLDRVLAVDAQRLRPFDVLEAQAVAACVSPAEPPCMVLAHQHGWVDVGKVGPRVLVVLPDDQRGPGVEDRLAVPHRADAAESRRGRVDREDKRGSRLQKVLSGHGGQ